MEDTFAATPIQVRPYGSGDGTPHILIVEDSLTVRMDLLQTFESGGFEVAVSETLASARAELARQMPSLVLLDIQLPDGDGTDLLRYIKSTLAPALPVMLLSSEADVSDRVRGLKTGADDYVGKPYDAGFVLARARELIAAGVRRQDEETACPNKAVPRLLLIDDSATAREHFKSILEGAGYRVSTAESGEEGLRTAIAIRPEAIIVDRVLPGGIDGVTVIRRLKQDVTLRNTPCLMLTGSSEDGEELRALEVGADACLNKAVGADVFLARMAALVRSGSAVPSVEVHPASLLATKKILAVDDSLSYLNRISPELREEGYEVIQALSGEQALELLDLQVVDAILMDVLMPGISGNQTCRIIKERPALRRIPLLMLTEEERSEGLIEGINCGADDYILKSADVRVLKARVHAQLRRKQFEDEHRFVREEVLRKELEAAEVKAEREIAQVRAALVEQLESKNRELEAFTYAVSHDLRSPLRTVQGFAQALLDDFGEIVPRGAAGYLNRILSAAVRMGHLIDALLELSRSTRVDVRRELVDLSQVANSIVAELVDSSQRRDVDWRVDSGLVGNADPMLMRVLFTNLLGNAFKYTGKTVQPKIEVGGFERAGETVYFVQDNGVGFNVASAKKLFQPFERLHSAAEFTGAGIGLATARRIVERHRGEIWAEGIVGRGAKFSFTLGQAPASRAEGSEDATRLSGNREILAPPCPGVPWKRVESYVTPYELPTCDRSKEST